MGNRLNPADGTKSKRNAMAKFCYRTSSTLDPEERLEDAAMVKALHDRFGDRLKVIPPEMDWQDGMERWGSPYRNQISDFRYWDDPAFIDAAGREFWVGPIDEAPDRIAALHDTGSDAFVKSTRFKHWIGKVARGQSMLDAMKGMEYSFMDGGPHLMVQEFVPMEFEWRFVVIDRRIVTHSPNAMHLTPIDHPVASIFRTPSSKQPERNDGSALGRMISLARMIAGKMRPDHAIVDCAMVGQMAVCVEMNPFVPGGFGLFACDVRAIARALGDLYSA